MARDAKMKSTTAENNVNTLTKKVAEQGDLVRQLKANKAEKAVIVAAVAELLNLKKLLYLAKGNLAPCRPE